MSAKGRYREEKGELVAALVMASCDAGATCGLREMRAFMLVVERAIHLGKYGRPMDEAEQVLFAERVFGVAAPEPTP